MSERRIFARQPNGNYDMLGLVADDEFVEEVTDESTGQKFKLARKTDRYVLYVPNVIEMTPDPEVPDAWKPFIAHGLHDDRQPAS